MASTPPLNNSLESQCWQKIVVSFFGIDFPRSLSYFDHPTGHTEYETTTVHPS